MKSKQFFLLFLVLMLFFGMIGQNVTLFMMDRLSEFSTVEMTAIVSDVSSAPTRDGFSYKLQVKEPEGELWIRSSVSEHLDEKDMKALLGQQISFWMDISTAEQYREMRKGNIVALQAEQEIFSIDDYNEIVGQVKRPASIICLFVQVVLLLLLIYLARKFELRRFVRNLLGKA